MPLTKRNQPRRRTTDHDRSRTAKLPGQQHQRSRTGPIPELTVPSGGASGSRVDRETQEQARSGLRQGFTLTPSPRTSQARYPAGGRRREDEPPRARRRIRAKTRRRRRPRRRGRRTPHTPGLPPRTPLVWLRSPRFFNPYRPRARSPGRPHSAWPARPIAAWPGCSVVSGRR
jgi:hypothetical protein